MASFPALVSGWLCHLRSLFGSAEDTPAPVRCAGNGGAQVESVLTILEERGFIVQCTEGLRDLLEREKVTVYASFDPTVASLHIGNLIPLVALDHFRQAGHRILVVLGGATAMVGRRSGRSEERPLLPADQVDRNLDAIAAQVHRVLDPYGLDPPVILNNAEWQSTVTLVDWLSDVGKHLSVEEMLAWESVRSRWEKGRGTTLTELTYMAMRASDFLHLSRTFGCALQCGGDDQWGNINAGIELIRRREGTSAFGLTFPLITTDWDEKIGTMSREAVWLDPQRTFPWTLYQYFIRRDPRDAGRLLRLLTFLQIADIEALEARTDRDAPHPRQVLAYEVTRMVHGERTAVHMANAHDSVYVSETRGLSDKHVTGIYSDTECTEVAWATLEAGIAIPDLLVMTGQSPGRNEALGLLEARAVYVNNIPLGAEAVIRPEHLASESYIILRIGRRTHLVRFT